MDAPETLLPIMLRTAGKLAVVVGAGAVGLRKLQQLIAAGMNVRLVDPGADAVEQAGIERVSEPYGPEHLHGATLAMACTDDEATNARVVEDARGLGVWVCRVDRPEEGDFVSPAVFRSESLLLAVATPGGSPAAAATIRDALAESLPDHADSFAAETRRLRKRVLASDAPAPTRRRMLQRLGSADALAAFARGGPEALEAMLEEPLEPDQPDMDGG